MLTSSPNTLFASSASSLDFTISQLFLLHELKLKKMTEDEESDIAIRFVDEND